jgi:hypothetical protein
MDFFSTKYRVKLRRDECGEVVAKGKIGQIYQHSETRMGLMLMPGKPFVWSNAKKKLLAAGFEIHQDGDREGSALFSAEDGAQVKLAMKLARVKTRRKASPAQLESLARARSVKQSVVGRGD